MNKYIYCFVILTLAVSCNLLSQNSSKNAPFSHMVQKGNDTLTIYARKINCDSAISYKFKVVKQKEVYRVFDHFEITTRLPKRCKDIFAQAQDKVVFTPKRRYHFPADKIDTLFLMEDLIRKTQENTGKCNSHFTFVLVIKNRRYESKRKECGQQILDMLHNLMIGELEIDNNVIDQQ